jgi:hypothetical protein
MTDPDETANLVPPVTEAYIEHAAAEGQPGATPGLRELTSLEVIYELTKVNALGALTVSGDDPVVITGPDEHREYARAVLEAHGLAVTRSPERDEWRRQEG